jgi:hypothetical protein
MWNPLIYAGKSGLLETTILMVRGAGKKLKRRPVTLAFPRASRVTAILRFCQGLP